MNLLLKQVAISQSMTGVDGALPHYQVLCIVISMLVVTYQLLLVILYSLPWSLLSVVLS
jgi:hypothetical protein